jgi:secondary thiamine-phosphate synthase enzyme
LRFGLVNVFVQHTSCSVVLTENADPSVRRDLETLAARWAPDGDPAYRHDHEGDDDMAAHGRNILAGASLTVPVGNGRDAPRNLAGNLSLGAPDDVASAPGGRHR